jgi:hypothetical protein
MSNREGVALSKAPVVLMALLMKFPTFQYQGCHMFLLRRLRDFVSIGRLLVKKSFLPPLNKTHCLYPFLPSSQPLSAQLQGVQQCEYLPNQKGHF